MRERFLMWFQQNQLSEQEAEQRREEGLQLTSKLRKRKHWRRKLTWKKMFGKYTNQAFPVVFSACER